LKRLVLLALLSGSGAVYKWTRARRTVTVHPHSLPLYFCLNPCFWVPLRKLRLFWCRRSQKGNFAHRLDQKW